MFIAIESPDVLTDSELDCIVDVWNEKHRRTVVKLFSLTTLFTHAC